ncbi:MAG: histidinol dehydrogenase [Actinobacteria bacterium]|nr:histidinol dehydrogenase [Actinomycetota bacterium]
MKIYHREEINSFLQKYESRRSDVAQDVENAVSEILRNVRDRGDAALADYAAQFDRTDLQKFGIKVAGNELKSAHQNLDENLLEALRSSRKNIERFHSKSLPQSWFSWEDDGVVLGQRVLPLERVGVYVPGGKAAYPSSLLMGVVPAQVAGVSEIVVVTPSDKNGCVNQTILAAAYELGIDKVFRVGGAHAIAALAYGTETIPRVDKIVGPGNIYVATAKKLLFGQCGIDMVAGPSEVAIIADAAADPVYVAADLLAQAEHDPLASAILLTDSAGLAKNVQIEFEKQLEKLSRKEIVLQSGKNYGGIILADSMHECIHLCNKFAPEHLGLHVQNAWDMLGQIKNAGAIFLGSYSPETIGDYWAGPNHILPTNGSARFSSPLRAEDFLKTSSVISFTKEAMVKHADKIITFAHSEGLDAHANAIQKRISE